MQVKDGAALRRARERLRYTQRELAVLAKCSQGTIWSLEAGRMSTCSLELATRISARLGQHVEDFFEQRSTPEMVTG